MFAGSKVLSPMGQQGGKVNEQCSQLMSAAPPARLDRPTLIILVGGLLIRFHTLLPKWIRVVGILLNSAHTTRSSAAPMNQSTWVPAHTVWSPAGTDEFSAQRKNYSTFRFIDFFGRKIGFSFSLSVVDVVIVLLLLLLLFAYVWTSC